MIQALQAQTMQNQGAGSNSPIESLNIAAAPVLAGLLARREAQAGEQQQRRFEALAGALSRANLPGPEGEAARRAAAIQAGGLPNNPLAQGILAGQAQQAFAPEAQGRPKAVTDIGKINEDERNGNITTDTADFLRSAAQNRDALSIGNAETALRKEFHDNLSGITEGLSSLANARNLIALEDNPIGAQAALTAFVRAIDNSVVRPSEQEQYQNIFGVAQGLENKLGQLIGEGAFSPESKRQILKAVDALAKSAEDIQRGAVDYYSTLATSSGLRPYNVTGFTFTNGQPSGPTQETQPQPNRAPSGPPELEIP